MNALSQLALDVLKQLARGPVWEGNVVSSGRVELIQAGLAVRNKGMTVLTSKGWRALAALQQPQFAA